MSRRTFLEGALATGAGGLLVACGGGADRPTAGTDHLDTIERFGPHQYGITTPPPPSAVMVALDAVAPTTAALAVGLRTLSREVQELSVGGGGDPGRAGAVEVIVAAGAPLFDDRYGLASSRPRELRSMPSFAHDELDLDRTHGDLLLTVSGDDDDATEAARARLVEAIDEAFQTRWTLAGGNERDAPNAHPRNAMGFLDGTSNPDTSREGMMRRFVWVQPRDDEPDWATDGTYQAVRVIRMHLDRWDGLDSAAQEGIIGRRKHDGAPLAGGSADDVPDYRDDPEGATTPLDAHIRLANPRDRSIAYEEILRRGFTYVRDDGDQGPGADRGLAFVAFQRSLDRGFVAIQARLEGEPLERFTVTRGGGFYFAFPGMTDAGDWLGRSMLDGV